MTTAQAERLGLGTITIYSLPMIPLGFMGGLVSMYLLKFSTDVLLLAPGIMGLLFGVSRIWDAVSMQPCAAVCSPLQSRRANYAAAQGMGVYS